MHNIKAVSTIYGFLLHFQKSKEIHSDPHMSFNKHSDQVLVTFKDGLIHLTTAPKDSVQIQLLSYQLCFMSCTAMIKRV